MLVGLLRWIHLASGHRCVLSLVEVLEVICFDSLMWSHLNFDFCQGEMRAAILKVLRTLIIGPRCLECETKL